MIRFFSKLSFSAGLFSILYWSLATPVYAAPTDEIVQKISAHVVKVQVGLSNGGYGLGSGVVIAKDQVVTNCHVIAGAVSVNINTNGENFSVSALKPDWHHDLCMLKVAGLNAPIATFGSSRSLKVEQPVYTVGFASFSPRPNGTFGFVKGIYAMDDSVVIRASNAFRLGDSGGGLFDDAGKLVGIVTVKSPGRDAFYYNMSVEWVQRLMNQPEQSVNSKSELPFWAKPHEKWPFFMRVVQPLKTQDWEALQTISSQWAKQESGSTEAIFYQAVAAFSLKNTALAEAQLNQVLATNASHVSALYYLGLIANQNGHRDEALKLVAALDAIDVETAKDLKLAMGIATD